MIARLTYRDAEIGAQSAALGDDGVWTGTDPDMARLLNLRVAVADRSPARGDWLLGLAYEVAEDLDAEIEAEDGPPDDGPEVRY